VRISPEVSRVIEIFGHNPYDLEPGEWDEGKKILADLDIPVALSTLIRRDNLQTAKSFLLSVGHALACDSDSPGHVLGLNVLPKAAANKLPRPRSAYARIATAAARCYKILSQIRGESAALRRTRREVWAACFGDSLRHAIDLEQVIHDHDVLILGETGTGKEAFALAMQAGTPGPKDGSAAPRAAINAAAIPDSLVESELFGHIKGSFTGATESRVGRLRSADGGSFFLDEVGDLPKTTQVKLLRVIETNEVYPVGSDNSHAVSLRYIAATHKDLLGMVEQGKFRRDLYERLAGNVIHIPPLRERPEDVVEIGLTFVRQYTDRSEHQKTIESFLHSREARTYNWPGNVRELQNVLRNLMLGLPPGLGENAPQQAPGDGPALPPAVASGSAPLSSVEDWYIRRVLAECSGNFSRAARILGLDRSTVRRRTEKRK
jgi:two-component system response regulator HydG